MIFLPAFLGNLLRHAILYPRIVRGGRLFVFSQKFSIRPSLRVEPVIACPFLTFHVSKTNLVVKGRFPFFLQW